MEEKNDKCKFQYNEEEEYCIVEIETSGVSSKKDEMFQIGIMKIKNGKQMEHFISFIKPEKELSQNIEDITGITNEMLQEAPSFQEILPQIVDFIKEDMVICYCSMFNVDFLKESYKKHQKVFKNPYTDLCRVIKHRYPDLKYYKLTNVADYLGIVRSEHFGKGMLERLLLIKHVFNVVVDEMINKI